MYPVVRLHITSLTKNDFLITMGKSFVIWGIYTISEIIYTVGLELIYKMETQEGPLAQNTFFKRRRIRNE